MPNLVTCEFEVFGKVQGVYFRKYTEKQAVILGLRGESIVLTCEFSAFCFLSGWCMNTSSGTVKGKLEGDEGRLRQMIEWLKTTGSPKSQISQASFSDPKPIKDFSVRNFTIKR